MLPFANMGADLIAHLGGAGVATLHRFAAGTHNQTSGYFDGGAQTDSSLDAVINPMSPKAEILPEGERAPEMIELYTSAELRVARQGAQADELTTLIAPWVGVRWRVVKVDPWSAQAGFFRAEAERIGNP